MDKTGKWNVFDVQVGRYEAWEVYHFGMGLDLYTFERAGAVGGPYVPQIYGLTYAFYRPDSVGQAAVHLYPTDWLRFEIGSQYGPDSIQGGGAGLNTVAVRPVAVADFGWVKAKAGVEYRDLKGSQDGQKQEYVQRGVGGALQSIVDPVIEFGLNAATGNQRQRSKTGRSAQRVPSTHLAWALSPMPGSSKIQSSARAWITRTWKTRIRK